MIRLSYRFRPTRPYANSLKRHFSIGTSDSIVGKKTECPFGGSSFSSAAAVKRETELTIVPSLPYLGSLVPQYSNTPKFDFKVWYQIYPELRRRFGDFYRMGIPGLGKGSHGELYIVTDPNEMQKILRQEKGHHPYPRGIVETEWPLIDFFKKRKSPLGLGTDAPDDEHGYMGRGETWKRMRTFLQTDLLSPQAANGYIPGMVEAAALASKGAPASASALNEYTNRCSFDLFCSLMFAEQTKMADPKTGTDPENIEFCSNAIRGMETMMAQLISPVELIMFNLGIKTRQNKEMAGACATAFAIAKKKYEAFKKRNEDNSLSAAEQESYLGRALVRQAAEDSNISETDLVELINVALVAAIDTTSSLLAWNVMHLAMNQDVQDKLRAELEDNVKKSGGLNADVLKKSSSPYLHAVIRESHRLTPAAPITLIKETLYPDVEIHGTALPKGSVVFLDSYSIGIDEQYVNDPKRFQPERWLSDAVESRKGTPSEVIDHPFYKDPFSQGSRKCPGSRVAANEVLIMISQLILDWKIVAPPQYKHVDDISYEVSAMAQPKLPMLDFIPL